MKNHLFILITILLFNCTGSTRLIDTYYKPNNFEIPINVNGTNSIKIHYTGCGGLIIKKGETILMTDPYFSNKGLVSVVAKTLVGGYVQSSQEDVNFGLNRAPMDIKKVKGVFISHSHYDHLMDVPWLLEEKIDPSAIIYGNHTMKFILERFGIDPSNILDVEPYMATRFNTGKWLDITTDIRVLPIKSHHAPHIGKIKLYGGEHKNNFKRKNEWKSKLNHWKEGQTLAYLFEFKEEGKSFNLFVQTSASEKPLGLPPLSVLASHPIDLAVLCVASYKNVQDYPHNHIQNLKPKAILFVHWEDFFRSYQKPPRTVRGTKVKLFPKQVAKYYDNTKFWMPKPGVTMKVIY